jgi:hypothetical protein
MLRLVCALLMLLLPRLPPLHRLPRVGEPPPVTPVLRVKGKSRRA